MNLQLRPVLLNEAKPRGRDRGRGQGPEAEAKIEARALRSRPRPRPIFKVEAKAEAKDKVINKKYQMLADNIQANLYHYDQHDTVYFSFSLPQ